MPPSGAWPNTTLADYNLLTKLFAYSASNRSNSIVESSSNGVE